MHIKLFLSAVLGFILVPLIETVLEKREELIKSVSNVPPAENTLIFAQVIFRHGHRTLTQVGTYPNDPNKYASYWPYNLGELTKDGMVETYRLGLELRQRYGKFIGKMYNSHIVGALTSPKSRCQQSMQCVFAAMFSPNEDERFLNDLDWRPIIYDILPTEKDDMFAVYDCDNYWSLRNTITNKTILDMLAYMEIHTGQPIKNNSAIFTIHDAIYTQMRLGKEQPEWVKRIYPEPLTSAAHQIYYDFLEQRLEYGAAGLYKRITKLTLDKLNGTLSPPRRKIMLYAAHEQTIVYALGGIKAYGGEVPKVASYLSFELHYFNQTYGIKVYFQNFDEVAPVAVNILGYGNFCPLEKFIEGVRWLTESRKGHCEF